VTISVEGRALPLADVIVALAGGESHMLLEDGAHFSLLAAERQSLRQLDIDTITEPEPPTRLAAELRPYQRDGFGWLASLWELELGGILADDRLGGSHGAIARRGARPAAWRRPA
jgi:hypothetical protein